MNDEGKDKKIVEKNRFRKKMKKEASKKKMQNMCLENKNALRIFYQLPKMIIRLNINLDDK